MSDDATALPGDTPDRDAAGVLATVDLSLRGPELLLSRIERGETLGPLVRSLVVTILIGGATFGAALGWFRGGIQILFGAIKLPLVLLLTTAASAPALTAFGVAFGRRADLRRDLALVLAALSRTSLALLALTPAVLLAVRCRADYHDVVLLAVAAAGLSGVAGLGYFFRGLRQLESRAVAATGLFLLVVFALVGAQMSWSLRPFVVRPRANTVPFVRDIEGGFLESVRMSVRSAAGIYDEVRRYDRARGECASEACPEEGEP